MIERDIGDEVPDEPEVVTPQGELTLTGRLMMASNATFLAEDETGRKFVHKPIRGERQLWDFPDGSLADREVATFALSRAAGFDVVPDTTMGEGPFGRAMNQVWLDDVSDDLVDLRTPHNLPKGWFRVVAGLDEHDNDVVLVHADHPGLRRLSLFDAVTNNADRKGAHVLHVLGDEVPGADHVYGCDHGLTFHSDDKLRTILWGWAGEPFTADEVGLLTGVLEVAEDVLVPHLTAHEVDATFDRVSTLLMTGTFPEPGDRWPVIPWPPL